MLTPKQLEKAADALIPIWDELKEWITLDLIERITARLTEEDISLSSSELWRLEVFEELGGLTDDLQERIKHTVRLSDDELRRVFIEHGVRSAADDSTVYEYIERARERARKSPRDASEEESAAHSDKLYSTEESPAERRTQRGSGGEEDSESQGSPLDNMSERMKDIMNDAYTRTNGELYNFTRTTADSVQTQFIRELDQAYLKVASGACSQWQAAQEAVDNIIKHQGTVTYPSGHTDTIETAVIRAVRTGIARMSGALAIEGAKEHGLNHVLVSSHLGARVGDGTPGHENHAWWQGKVYTIEGGSEEYPNLEEATGYPSDPRGLCGYNCRHNMRPFAPDVMYNSTKQYDPEENEEAYEISQQLRRMERRLRAMRTAVRAATNAFYSCTDEDLRESLEDRMNKFAGKYDRLKDEYLDFCDTHGIRPSYERLFEARDRVGKSANSGGEISTPESVANSGESGIIISRGLTKINDSGQVVNPMDQTKYQKMKANLEKRGCSVVAAHGDDEKFLKAFGAEAISDVKGIIHLGDVPSASAFFEEIIHFTQTRKYGELESTDFIERDAREIAANRMLLKNGEAYGFTKEDFEDIRNNLTQWEKDFIERVGVGYDESEIKREI